jgi:membrane protein DedA with SNARE-associated domain
MIKDYITAISEIVSQYGYVAVFVALVLENTFFLGVVIPGILVLIVAGFYSGIGTINLPMSIIAGVLGTFIGDNLSFLLGRLARNKVGPIRRFLDKYQPAAEKIKSQRAIVLVFFQFPVYMRVVLPVLFGSIGFPLAKWIRLDVIASILFNVVFIGLGFAAAKITGMLSTAQDISSQVQIFFGAVFTVWVAMLVWKIYKSRRK